MRGPALPSLVAAIVALGLVPILAPPFYANLLVPFFGYAIALLGFNLLFGYAGLLSFGHAHVPRARRLRRGRDRRRAGHQAVRDRAASASALAGLVVALPIGCLCVRYTGIFFGMLTLAFGMLAHSVLFKFYHLTGGDSGMRVPRMRILGLEFAAYNKIELLAGPFYYYCLALLVLAAPLMWRIVHSPVRPAPARAARQRAEGRVPGRARAPVPARGVRHLRRLWRHRRRHPGLSHRPRRPRARLLDALGPSRVHDRARRLLQLPRPDRRRPGADAAAGPAAVLHAVLALRAGRHPRRRRHLLPARAGRPGWRRRSFLLVTAGEVPRPMQLPRTIAARCPGSRPTPG